MFGLKTDTEEYFFTNEHSRSTLIWNYRICLDL